MWARAVWAALAILCGCVVLIRHVKVDAHVIGSIQNVANSCPVRDGYTHAGILLTAEHIVIGSHPEDVQATATAVAQGNSWEIARDYTEKTLAPWAKSLGVKLVASAYGSGWTAANNWKGNYDKPGDLSAYVALGNVHTYPGLGPPLQTTSATIQRLNGLGKLVTPSHPIITSEIGWNRSQGWTETQVAKNVLQAAFGGFLAGNPLTVFYALFDDASGQFGLMNADGTPTQAGIALHNLTQLLRLSGSSDAGPLFYSWPLAVNDQALMLSAAGGVYWLAVWNEIDAERNVTVAFREPHTTELHFPLTGRIGTKQSPGMSVVVPVSDEVAIVSLS